MVTQRTPSRWKQRTPGPGPTPASLRPGLRHCPPPPNKRESRDASALKPKTCAKRMRCWGARDKTWFNYRRAGIYHRQTGDMTPNLYRPPPKTTLNCRSWSFQRWDESGTTYVRRVKLVAEPKNQTSANPGKKNTTLVTAKGHRHGQGGDRRNARPRETDYAGPTEKGRQKT